MFYGVYFLSVLQNYSHDRMKEIKSGVAGDCRPKVNLDPIVAAAQRIVWQLIHKTSVIP